jgi:hypothetical protein
VVRCRTCRAYINPYVTFPPEKGGTVWICNLCYRFNEVVSPYFSSLDSYGRRNDLADRPELIHSTIEIVAPVEVCFVSSFFICIAFFARVRVSCRVPAGRAAYAGLPA